MIDRRELVDTPYIYIDKNKRKYKVMLLQDILQRLLWDILLSLLYKITPQDFAQLIFFIVSNEVYSDILTGGYAVTAIIYSYIFCIYRYYNNMLLVS